MSIQANINQTLSLAGMLTAMNPSVKAAAEKRAQTKNLATQEKAKQKYVETAAQSGDSKQAESYQTDLAEIKKRQFELDPSAESYGAYKEAYQYTPEGMKERAITVEQEPEEAAREMVEKESREHEIETLADQMRAAQGLPTKLSKPEEAANKAQEAVQTAQEEKRRGRPRRDFLQYIGGEQTNLGIPVSALAKTPEQKAAIRGAYTKQEKTKIMNEMEEKKSGK